MKKNCSWKVKVHLLSGFILLPESFRLLQMSEKRYKSNKCKKFVYPATSLTCVKSLLNSLNSKSFFRAKQPKKSVRTVSIDNFSTLHLVMSHMATTFDKSDDLLLSIARDPDWKTPWFPVLFQRLPPWSFVELLYSWQNLQCVCLDSNIPGIPHFLLLHPCLFSSYWKCSTCYMFQWASAKKKGTHRQQQKKQQQQQNSKRSKSRMHPKRIYIQSSHPEFVNATVAALLRENRLLYPS